MAGSRNKERLTGGNYLPRERKICRTSGLGLTGGRAFQLAERFALFEREAGELLAVDERAGPERISCSGIITSPCQWR